MSVWLSEQLARLRVLRREAERDAALRDRALNEDDARELLYGERSGAVVVPKRPAA